MSDSDPNRKTLHGERLLIRADAHPEIGSGHVTRCLALAQTWEDCGGKASFASVTSYNGFTADEGNIDSVILAAEAGSPEDAEHTIRIARDIGAEWVVIDGYQFGADYQHALKHAGLKVLFVDDYGHASRYCADLVLNQNAGASELLYRNREAFTRLLLGPKYILLRRQFRQWRNWNRDIPAIATRILVTTGGSDPLNASRGIIEALQYVCVQNLQATLVAGELNQHRAELEAATRSSSVMICLKHSVTNMAELMSWADVAVSGAGSTCWELAFMGLPNLAFVLSDNQQALAESLASAGASLNLGPFGSIGDREISEALRRLLLNSQLRRKMSESGRLLVDGLGCERVVTAMNPVKLQLRDAEENDADLLWRWVSEPAVRTASFSSDPISWEEHREWFTRKLRDHNCFIFIAMDHQKEPVGQARFDLLNPDEAEIDVSISSANRGAGLGSLMIDIGFEKLMSITSVRTVHAFIKPENTASIMAFARANFEDAGMATVNGYAASHFIRSRLNAQRTTGVS